MDIISVHSVDDDVDDDDEDILSYESNEQLFNIFYLTMAATDLWLPVFFIIYFRSLSSSSSSFFDVHALLIILEALSENDIK